MIQQGHDHRHRVQVAFLWQGPTSEGFFIFSLQDTGGRVGGQKFQVLSTASLLERTCKSCSKKRRSALTPMWSLSGLLSLGSNTVCGGFIPLGTSVNRRQALKM